MAKWCRVLHAGQARLGQLRGAVEGVSGGDSVALFDGDLFGEHREAGEEIPAAEAHWLPPVVPGAFLGLWNNFHERRAAEGLFLPRSPLYFVKFNCLAAHGEAVRRPPGFTGPVKFEAELGIVVGRPCFQVPLEAVDAHILGYTCVNDFTAPGPLKEEPGFTHWCRAKSFPGFGPIGPVIATDLDPDGLRIIARLDGETRQDYPVSDMIFRPREILHRISQEVALMPGDVIACGTSSGAAEMAPGQVIEVEIPGIGVLRNRFEPTD